MKRNIVLAVVCAALLSSAAFAQNKKAETKKGSAGGIPTTVIVLTGEKTGGVDEGLNAGLENFLGQKLVITTVDREAALKDPKYAGLNLDYMPLYLLQKNKTTEEKFAQPISQGFIKTNNNFIIMEKQTRYGVYVGQPRQPNVLDIFVMSQCPYGVMAENRIIDAQKLGRLPQDLQVNIHYIVSEGRTPDTFSSLHGTGEWEENVRQLIIKDKFPKKFWKYLEIRNKDYQSSLWDQAAEKAGINPRVFNRYWKHGMELLKKDMEYAKKFNVSASPTILWEGRVVTDLNGLSQIPGLEGLAQQNFGGGAPAGGAPQGQC